MKLTDERCREIKRAIERVYAGDWYAFRKYCAELLSHADAQADHIAALETRKAELEGALRDFLRGVVDRDLTDPYYGKIKALRAALGESK